MFKDMKGYIFVITAVFFWGTQGTFGKFIMNTGIHPVTLAAYRIMIAALLFLVMILLTDRKSLKISKEDIGYFFVFGLITISGLHFCFNYAIYYTGVATATILLYTAPAFVTVLSILFFNEKPTLMRIFAILLTMAGCYFITIAESNLSFNKTGIIFGVLAGFCYGMWSILSKKSLDKYSTPVINFYALMIGGLILWAISLFMGEFSFNVIGHPSFVLVVIMAVVNTFIPNNFYVNGMKYMPASKASILGNLELIVAMVLSYVVFQETFTGYKIIGFALIILGLVCIVYEDVSLKKAEVK